MSRPPSPDAAAIAASRDQLAARIRALHAQEGGLSRVHREHPALYARARRAFGSWRDAVRASGLDWHEEVDRSLIDGLRRRDERRATGRALHRFLADHPEADDAALAARRPDLARKVQEAWGDLARARAWLARRP